MGKEKLRDDKTCLNCRHVVENRYCPNCGQENTNTRKTFHHLFIHFFEDLTHYENAFWKTIRNLLFKPSALTKEYLSGKRLSYLAPVRLYIFISFVTFFLLAVLPTTDLDSSPIEVKDSTNTVKDSIDFKKIAWRDSIKPAVIKIKEMVNAGTLPKPIADNMIKEMEKSAQKEESGMFNMGFKDQKELDSIQKYGSEDDKVPDIIYKMQTQFFKLRDHNTKEEMWDKFKEALMHNFPKALFIYMPMFAFFLWVFHGKKRWYYFDHGIFTLHYFSFLLLISLILKLTQGFLHLFGSNMFTIPLNMIIHFVGYLWMFYYFFPAHHRFYGESRIVSLIKSLGLLFINVILMSFMMVAIMGYTLLTMH